mgnify:CR=1 FL=1
MVDRSGKPCSANVSLVSGEGGSLGVGTTGVDGNEFVFSNDLFGHARMMGPLTLQATTEDDRVAVLGGIDAMRPEDIEALVLTVEPGAKLELSLDGVYETLRCRLLHDGVIFEDFTLRKTQPAREGGPAGPRLIQLYSGGGSDMFVRDERALSLRAGDAISVAFVVER